MELSRKGVSQATFAVGIIVALVVAGAAGFYGGQSLTPATQAMGSTQTMTSTVVSTVVSTTTVSQSSSGLVNLKIAYGKDTAALPLYMGLYAGIFKDYGFNVSLVPVFGGQAVEALATGQVQLAELPTPSAISYAVSTGTYLKFVASMAMEGTIDGRSIQRHEVIARTGVSITSPQDFVGKTVATAAIGGASDIAFRYLLLKNGVNPSSVTIKELRPGDEVGALQAGQIDIANLFPPYTDQMLAAGTGTDVDSVLTGSPTTDIYVATAGNPTLVVGLFTTQQNWNSNPALYANFVRAYLAAEAYIYLVPQEAIQAVAKGTGLSLSVVQNTTFSEGAWHPYGPNSQEVIPLIQGWINAMNATGFLTKPVNAAGFLGGSP